MLSYIRPRTAVNSLTFARRSPISTMSKQYEAIVIGSGQGGTPLAQAFAVAGKRTALVESTHVGGTCVNEGCTPTKTMIASGRMAYTLCGAKSMGVEFKRSSLNLNMDTVRKRKREIVESFRGGSEARVQKTPGLDLIMGKARFRSSDQVDVVLNETGELMTLTAAKIFINAGCSPGPLNIKDSHVIEPSLLLTSTTIMELGIVPRHLLVIGGGPIGVEFAQLFRRFGSTVTIVQRAAHLLPKEDHDISIEVEKILTEDGINLYLGAQAQWFSKVPTGSIILQIKTASGATKSVFASHVLNAAGRPPNTKDLNLEAAGIETDVRGFIKTNDQLETAAPNIYALGDIKGGPAFTHISYDDSRILKHNLLTHPASPPLTTTGRVVPSSTFIDPPLARIGLTETEAHLLYPSTTTTTPPIEDTSVTPAQENPAAIVPNPRIASVTMPMSYVARALEINESRGMMKAVIDRETNKILGFACLAFEGSELMNTVQMAMMGGLTWRELRDCVFAHPTMGEALNNLFSIFGED